MLCVVFSCSGILRIEVCLNSTLQQYSWNPLGPGPGSWRRAKRTRALLRCDFHERATSALTNCTWTWIAELYYVCCLSCKDFLSTCRSPPPGHPARARAPPPRPARRRRRPLVYVRSNISITFLGFGLGWSGYIHIYIYIYVHVYMYI